MIFPVYWSSLYPSQMQRQSVFHCPTYSIDSQTPVRKNILHTRAVLVRRMENQFWQFQCCAWWRPSPGRHCILFLYCLCTQSITRSPGPTRSYCTELHQAMLCQTHVLYRVSRENVPCVMTKKAFSPVGMCVLQMNSRYAPHCHVNRLPFSC